MTDGEAWLEALGEQLRESAKQIPALAAAQAKFVPPHPDAKSAPPVVGVVGCGQLGTQLLRSLLALGWPPNLLAACSRNEQNFEKFRKEGVQCTTDAAKLAAWDQGAGGCRCIILCVPHAQLRRQLERAACQPRERLDEVIDGSLERRLARGKGMHAHAARALGLATAEARAD